jgi:hypothetical protein
MPLTEGGASTQDVSWSPIPGLTSMRIGAPSTPLSMLTMANIPIVAASAAVFAQIKQPCPSSDVPNHLARLHVAVAVQI